MSNHSRSQALVCPSCKSKGKRVGIVTLQSLLTTEAADRIGGREYRYCNAPECRTVYFAADGTAFTTQDLVVRVGVKETAAPRPICYCFDHTVEGIEAEIRETGESTVLDDIKQKMEGGCWCETKSPHGTCCLGTVGRQVKEACERLGIVPQGSDAEHVGCCGPETTSSTTPASDSKGRYLTAGAVLSAVLASACCWLPLLLLAFGVSAVGVSAAFEKFRPLFLGIAAILLGGGFYFAYFRRQECGSGGDCSMPNPRLKRFNRAMLWIATVAVVAFAFFPSYVGLLIADDISTPVAEQATVTFNIDGMTCEGCTTHVRKALANVAGVESVAVVYADRQARVAVDPASPPPTEALLTAVEKAGYKATPVSEDR